MLSILYETNIFYIVGEYLFNPEYKDNFFNSDIQVKFELNLFSLIKYVLVEYDWTYDYMLIWGTNIFQLLIPIFASISAIIFYIKNQTINKFIFYREKSYKWYNFKEMLKISLKTSLSVFFAFLVLFIFSIIISKGATNPNISREFLLDILGDNFYSNYTLLYYFLDGTFRLFLIPLIYSILACSASLLFKNTKQVFLVPIIYYFGLTIISYFISNFITYGIYISPLIAMVPGDYYNINSLCVMIMPLLAILISIFIIFWKGKYIEI